MKVAIIKKEGVPTWKSCQSISLNLFSAWQGINNIETKAFYYDDDYHRYKITITALAIQQWLPDLVVFIDHSPCPAKLIDNIYKIYNGQKLPKLIIHTYGDFALQTPEWIKIKNSFAKFKTIIFAASNSQKKFIAQFLNSSANIEVLPFPVDTNFFHPLDTPQNKNTNFLYTGRITIQKNIYELIKSFQYYKKTFNTNDILSLVGPFDDMNIPYLGKISFELSYNTQLLPLFSTSSNYEGNYSQESLRAYYQKANCLVNVSTYNDEDYGMSVIEALACGNTTILSSWGGFKSFFDDFSEYVTLIPVKFSNDNTRLIFDRNKLIKAFLKHSQLHLNFEQKIKLHKKICNNYSINAISKKIKTYLHSTNKFNHYSFSDELFYFSAKLTNIPLHPFRAELKYQYGEDYKKWYKCYWDTKHDK